MEPRPAPPLAQSKTVMSPDKLMQVPPASDEPASWPEPAWPAQQPVETPPESVWSRPKLEESNVESAGIDISLDESSESSAVPAREAGFSWPDNPAEPPAPISWSDELIAGPDAASRIVAEPPKWTDKRSASEPNPEVAQPSKMAGYQSAAKIPSTLQGSPPPASPVVAKGPTLPPVSPYAPTVPQQVYRPEPYDPRPKSVGDAARPKFPDAPSSGNGAKIAIVVLLLLLLVAAAIVYFFVRR